MALMHESFLRYARYRWLKLALLLGATCIALFIAYDPPQGRGGGTWLGYGLGTLGALMILWLAWLGVRKRRYRANSVFSGWVSAHVYLGLSLIVVASLHSAFHVGWNIHTLAYVLMLLVIASGAYGINAYARLPAELTANRGELPRDALIAEVLDLNDQAVKLADQLGPLVHRVVVRSAERVRIGGNLRDQLFGPRQPPRLELEQLQQTLAERARALLPARNKHSPDTESTVMFMAGALVDSQQNEQEAGRIQQLLALLGRRNELIGRVNRDIQLHARLRLWLYLHVPLTLALLAALTAHIVSVFIYW